MSEVVEAPARRARAAVSPSPAIEGAPSTTPAGETRPMKKAERPSTLTVLDFYPLEDANLTRLSAFYQSLAHGKLTTTRCRKDGALLWPPRVVCPRCHTGELDWVDLPHSGRIYAFSAVLAGAPLGMEDDLPFVVGLVDLDGVPLRLFGRIEGSPWTDCRVGQRVTAETFQLADGRWFYRFRT